MSEALIYTSTSNPYCSLNYEFSTWKLQACNSMKILLSYCGLVDARISASEKDLPVIKDLETCTIYVFMNWGKNFLLPGSTK